MNHLTYGSSSAFSGLEGGSQMSSFLSKKDSNYLSVVNQNKEYLSASPPSEQALPSSLDRLD